MIQTEAKVIQTEAKVIQTEAKVIQTEAKVIQTEAKVIQTDCVFKVALSGFFADWCLFVTNISPFRGSVHHSTSARCSYRTPNNYSNLIPD
ncbi:MAG: hypothetical protein IPM47_12140 [Sphingobacteriales bacterium]|nr:MAG: hypothetical protein IPM47_12140 [Sphingobacteriales bacterium]